MIHDAARPFASADLIARTIAAAAESGAALAALPARDTVKRCGRPPAGAVRQPDTFVRETLPRETIYLAQTPQAFRRDVLREALALGARERVEATDEATLAERAGHAVRLVEGEASNIKITTPEDLHDRRGDCAQPGREPQPRPRPVASAPATTCIGWSRAGRWCSAA